MSEQEGVIQFNLSHQVAEAVQHPQLDALIIWHQRMHELGLIDQDPSRYDGYAYGNMSHRLKNNEFLISGTQTGGIDKLTAKHYAHVTHCDISNNSVYSSGPIKPSSECMSHAAIYTADSNIMAVIHIHNPEIWQQHQALRLATTPTDVEYGTPEMAASIQDCIKQSHHCVAMLGHLDGIICYADNIDTAGQQVIALYKQAQSLV
ncbi:MAG: class II aldolase/adducin family protein [Sulfuriflexus sp.]|nr:class II aldolase/adducin family protein [Sulfuriflexus sp.]